MKDQPLEALMADPSFDPTVWMLSAFKDYMSDNPQVVLADETSRPYLLEALETDTDWNRVIRRLPPDREIIKDVIRSMKRIPKDADVSISRLHRNFRDRIVSLENDPTTAHSWGDMLLLIPGLQAKPAISTVQHLNGDQILQGIEIWKTHDWEVGFWDKVISLLHGNSLIRLLEMEKFPKMICTKRETGWNSGTKTINTWKQRIIRFQDLLIKILARIPDTALTAFGEAVARIRSADLEKLYTKRKNKSDDWVEDPRIWTRRQIDDWSGETELVKTTPNIMTGLMCRCGFMASSSSGLTLHQKGCEFGKHMTFAKVFELHLAERGVGPELMCRKCGKVCKSKPGFTLHRKKCTVHYSSGMLYRQCI